MVARQKLADNAFLRVNLARTSWTRNASTAHKDFTRTFQVHSSVHHALHHAMQARKVQTTSTTVLVEQVRWAWVGRQRKLML